MSKLIRLSEDKTKGVVQEDNVFSVLDFTQNTVEDGYDDMPEGSWVEPSTEDRLEMLPLVAAMSDSRRRRKAEAQPRDTSGRWVAAGANVRWRSNGQDWSGTVEAIKNGKAIVKVRHDDGSVSQTTLMPDTLRVLASKARLSSSNKPYKDTWNNSREFIRKNRPEIEKSAENGGAKIDREDGYSIDALKKPIDGDGDGILNEKDDKDKKKVTQNGDQKLKPEDKSKKPQSNPLIYQLYAPNGKSLGIFDGEDGGEDSIDDVISSDKGEESTNNSEGGQKTSINGDVVIVSSGAKEYSVPSNVQESIRKFITNYGETLSDETLMSAAKLCSGSPVSYEDMEYIREFFGELEGTIDLYGGYSGSKWISKIDKKQDLPEPNPHNFMDSVFSYFVYGDSGTNFVGLIAVDYDRDIVLGWTGNEFGLELGPVENFDADIIEYVDEYTAFEVSKLLNGNTTSFSLMDVFPDERNLFTLAHSEIDFQLLDDIAKFAYESGDRSLDAQKQARGEGGKFGRVGTSKEATNSDEMGDAKYFAIVDEVDTSAVMDIIAIVNKDGTPQLFKRLMNQWVPDAELLQDIEGPTPPPVSLLTTPEAVKEVLSQVDAYDNGEDPIVSSGFSLRDGSLNILTEDDLYVAVYTVSENPDIDGILHVVKRAKALNRMDVVPEDWRVFTANHVDSQALYGEYGEVLTASASPVEMSNIERLEDYWLSTDKIDWTSSYAVDYASGMLSKYLGEQRAYAFATILKSKAGEL